MVRLCGWEKDVVRSLFYMAPDGEPKLLSLSEAAERAVGVDRIHPDKLEGLARKLVTLGYGQAEKKEITVPSFDIDFKLNAVGYGAATELVKAREYRPPLRRISSLNWATLAAIISAIAAVASAIFAYRVSK